jgi:hypothetical protein
MSAKAPFTVRSIVVIIKRSVEIEATEHNVIRSDSAAADEVAVRVSVSVSVSTSVPMLVKLTSAER